MASKADQNIILALLNDLSGDPSAMAGSTAAIAEADIKRDGADKQDIYNIAANSVLTNPIQKIMFVLGQHPELTEDIAKQANMDITPILISGDIPLIKQLFFNYLKSKNVRYAQDGVKLELSELNSYKVKDTCDTIKSTVRGVLGMGEGGLFESDLKEISVKIGDKTFELLVAETEEAKERGLMNVEEMDDDEGMLFDYSDNPQDEISFWMKDTSIPLDIIFVGEDGDVISVKQGVPNSEEPITEKNVACVIEVNQNSGIKPGDETDLFDDEEQEKNIKVNKLYIYGADGQIQGEIEAGARIFSRPNTKTLIRMCKRAYLSKSDSDYKRLGRKMFEYIKQQDNRPPEYV